MTRFVVINDERRIILGRDLSKLFKPDVIYEAKEILGEIILSPIDSFALPEKGYPSKLSDINTILESGLHIITKKELKLLNKKFVSDKINVEY